MSSNNLKMAFLTFPKSLTEEEKMLKEKYAYLQRKKKQLRELQAPKKEPEPAPVPIKRDNTGGPKADAKEVAKKLLKSGAIEPIKAPPSNATTGFKRKKIYSDKPGGDRPGGFQPFSMARSNSESDSSSDPVPVNTTPELNPLPRPSYNSLYDNFILAKDAENIARDETLREKRRDRVHYVNRDNPSQGNTIYVKGVGLYDKLLMDNFSVHGTIKNISVETEKNCAFVTFETIDEANKAIDEMDGRTIEGITILVSMAKRQLRLPNSSNPVSLSPDAGTSNSWSAIAANFTAIKPQNSNTANPKASIRDTNTSRESRNVRVYDEIPDE